jgi:probable O-glycosylation ligase (exosortase A-associated)
MFLSEIVFYLATFIIIIGAIYRPFIGLAGYYALSFLRPQNLYFYALANTNLSFYVGLATILSFMFHYGLRRGILVRIKNEFFLLLAIYLLLAVNSYVFSQNPANSFYWFDLLSKTILMAMVTVLMVNDVRQIRTLILVIVVCVGYLAYRANYQYFFEGVWTAEPPRGWYGDNNYFAMQFAMTIPLAFFLFFTERRNPLIRWAALAVIPFMIHAIVLTYSRGGFIGMGFVLFGCVLFLKQRRWIIPMGIILFLIVARLQGEQSRERMSTLTTYEEDPAVTSRFESWRAGINMTLDNLWSGVGVGNFTEKSQSYNPKLTQPRSAHNVFVEVGGEMGALAAAFYISLILFAFYRLWQIRQFYRPLAGEIPHFYYAMAISIALVGFVVCGMFLSLNFLEYFYVAFGMVGALMYIYERDLRQLRAQSE